MASVPVTFEVPFGILNLKGLMATDENKVVTFPVFAHETYPITTTLDPAYNKLFGNLSYYDKETNKTFEGKTYQKLYRKVVRWNFGDGTEIEGYSATHSYALPGKYTITCTFFDINRQGIQNGYKIQVIVKQVIPTMLAFVKNESSLETITCSKIEKLARVEVLQSNNLKEDMDILAQRVYQEGESSEPHWNDIKDLEFPHLRKYQTFLERKIEYYYDSMAIYKERFNPVEKYSPEYENLYGYFSVSGNNLVFNCYRVQPYASVARMPNIQINNPNASILGTETFSQYAVTDVSTEAELPQEAKFVGKRAYLDIFYKTDFINSKDTVFISFDIDNVNVHNSIEASTNFLNVAPLGLHFSVQGNNLANASFSCTLNGFVTSYEDIDKLVQLSLVKDYTFNTLLIPYFRSQYNEYYIPKDLDLAKLNISTSNGNDNDSTIVTKDVQMPYIRTYEITGKSRVNFTIKLTQGTTTKSINFNYPVKDLSQVTIPTEKYYNQDVEKLINVYTPHELFRHTPKVKSALIDVFKNRDLLDYILTKSVNFFDDNVNAHSNYVIALLSTLHMMGKDAFEYDQTTFEGVNEVRDLCRILSMNHSELVGNLIDEQYDIKYTESYKGKHIGEEILVTDELYVIPANDGAGVERYKKGKITKVKRNGKLVDLDYPTLLVFRDNYTNETKMVSFSDLKPTKTESNLNVFQLKNYSPTWGWGLLLPDKEDKDGKILESYYSFYLLVKPDHNVRVGNFLQENTITPETETKSTWEEADGKTFDKLQKIIHQSLDI